MQKIATALVKAQKEFAPALRTSTIGHLNRKYADLATCIEAVIDALNNNGIALTQQTFLDDTGVTVETVFIHESGEIINGGKLHVPASKQDPQGYGSALTYARRYSLMSACAIAPEDDDGEAATKQAPKPTAKAAVRKGKAAEEIAVLIAGCETLTALQVLYAGLTPEELEETQAMFTVRKKELLKDSK